jgi:CubicO group peptidase (beta-lactamase class C family)
MAANPWHSPDGRVYLDVSRAEHEQFVAGFCSQNALLSLSMYGGDASQGTELYTAVWSPTASGTREFHGYSLDDFRKLYLEQGAQGYLPSRVAAYGQGTSVRVACAFEPSSVIQGCCCTVSSATAGVLYSIDVAETNLSTHIDAARETRMRIRSVACYGQAPARFYIIVWEPNGVVPPIGAPSDGSSAARRRWQQVAWSDLATDPDASALGRRVRAQEGQGAFPLVVVIGPDGGPISTFTTMRLIGPNHTDVFPTADAVGSSLDAGQSQHSRPAWIYAGGPADSTSYAVGMTLGAPERVAPTFAIQRWKDNPNIPPATAAAIDLAAQTFVQQESAPAGAVGLAYKGQLVFHHTYSYSSAIAPPAQKDRFRWASCSKVITALAAARLVVLGHASLDEPIAKVLGGLLIPQPGKSFPTLGQITIADLITHTAGVDDQWDYDSMVTFAGRRPITTVDYCNYVLAHAGALTPNQRVYSNAGYSLLGLWLQYAAAERIGGITTYFDAVKQLVMVPMNITNIALSGRVFADKPFDEVTAVCNDGGYSDRISRGNLMTGMSVCTPTPQLVAGAYGLGDIEIGWPAAGWTISAGDFALLMSGFSDGSALFPQQGDATLAWLRRANNFMWDASQQLPTGTMLVKGGGMGGTGAAVGWDQSGWSWSVTVATDVLCMDFNVPALLVSGIRMS